MVVKRMPGGRKQTPKKTSTASDRAAKVGKRPFQGAMIVRGKRIDRMGLEERRGLEANLLTEANTISAELQKIPMHSSRPGAVESRRVLEERHADAIANLRKLRSLPGLGNEAYAAPTLPSTWWRSLRKAFR